MWSTVSWTKTPPTEPFTQFYLDSRVCECYTGFRCKIPYRALAGASRRCRRQSGGPPSESPWTVSHLSIHPIPFLEATTFGPECLAQKVRGLVGLAKYDTTKYKCEGNGGVESFSLKWYKTFQDHIFKHWQVIGMKRMLHDVPGRRDRRAIGWKPENQKNQGQWSIWV